MENKMKSLAKAVAILQNDAGCLLKFEQVAAWYKHLPEIDKQLSRLSSRQLHIFTVGDEEQMKKLQDKFPGTKMAAEFLDDVFEPNIS